MATPLRSFTFIFSGPNSEISGWRMHVADTQLGILNVFLRITGGIIKYHGIKKIKGLCVRYQFLQKAAALSWTISGNQNLHACRSA